MPWNDLTDEERAAILRLVREEVTTSRWPLSPTTRLLRGALDKLDPPPPKPAPLPPLKPAGQPSTVLSKGRRRR